MFFSGLMLMSAVAANPTAAYPCNFQIKSTATHPRRMSLVRHSGRPTEVENQLDEIQSTAGWAFVVNKHEVDVWKRGHDATSDEATFAVKATLRIPVPPRLLADILLTRDYGVIRRFNPTVCISIYRFFTNIHIKIALLDLSAVFPDSG